MASEIDELVTAPCEYLLIIMLVQFTPYVLRLNSTWFCILHAHTYLTLLFYTFLVILYTSNLLVILFAEYDDFVCLLLQYFT